MGHRGEGGGNYDGGGFGGGRGEGPLERIESFQDPSGGLSSIESVEYIYHMCFLVPSDILYIDGSLDLKHYFNLC